MDHVASLEQQAIDLARRGEFSAHAKGINEEITALAPENAGAWTRLARCCIELGLLDEGNAALERALHLNPQNTIARGLQGEIARRRSPPPVAAPRRRAASTTEPRAPRSRTAAGESRGTRAGVFGFGRAEFTALATLPPPTALESLGPRIEALLMALSDRPFSDKVVEARHRAGYAGGKLYRRNSFYSGGPGHIFAFHHGGRWEPQLNLGWYAGRADLKDALRIGIGFNFTANADDPEQHAGQERVVEYFQRFQQLVSGAWRQLLTTWMSSNRGFIQYGSHPPAMDLLPADAVEWIVRNENPVETGWIFVGRWLFPERSDDMSTLTDGAHLVRAAERTFTDLLPLWSSVYRG